MTTVEEDDDSIEINLRSTHVIGARLAALGAVLSRISLETNAPVGGDAAGIAEAEEERLDAVAWLRSEGVEAALSTNESSLLRAAIGALSFDAVAESSWQAERLAVLAWAASLTDRLPDLDKEADISAAIARIPSPWESISVFITTISPRTDEEIAFEIERSEVWLWRAETEVARKTAARDDLPEIAEAIAEVVAEGAAMGLLNRAPDGDFLANGSPFHLLSENVQAKIAVIASERLRALNWLRGAEDDWDNLSAEV